MSLPKEKEVVHMKICSMTTDRKKLVMELWTRAGCLVKDCSGKKGFEGKSFIRIAVKSAADNAQFIAALKELK